MGDRVFDDDRPTVDLGPMPSEDDLGGPDRGADDGHATVAGRRGRVHGADLGPDDDHARHGADLGPDPEPTRSLAAVSPPKLPDPVHHLPTQQLPLRGAKPSSRSAASMTKLSDSKTTSSPVEAMRHDEIERARVFVKVALGLCISGAIAALVARGDAIAQRTVVIGSGLGALGAIWILLIVRDAASYAQRQLLVPSLMLVAGSMSGVYYWGIASPVAAMLVYGIYFFSLGADRRVTLLMYLVIAVSHGALALSVISGQLVDRGVVSMQALALQNQVALLVIIESLYFIAFLTARLSQKVTLEAMNKLESAVRGMAQRDALLAEARAELDRALKIGGPGRFTDQVVGGFRLGVLIGRGGMGEVYEAHAEADRREAAVKLLHPGTLADPTSVQRFIREAEMAARLDTPYVVRVLAVGTTAGEIPFIAMERLRGHDLAHQLRRQRRLQLPAARQVISQVALGLEAARVAGIVHRDLKPHNVFLAEVAGNHTWKILDFGVSKAGGSGTLTKGHIVGTPAYMAPEQARGEDVDHRADVYSLAAILFRAVTGHPAFTGKDVPTTLYEVVYRIPTQPSILAPVPADVDRVIALGLAKDPRDRFATAAELAAWFTAAVDSRLDPEQRRRADELIGRQPWGTRPALVRSAS